MQTTLPHGLWPVMLTPFTSEHTIDYPALDALIEWYIENGVSGLFAICQSSEMDYLSISEKISLLTHIMQRLNSRLPVVAAGLPENKPEDYARHCLDLGISALVLLPNRLIDGHDDETTCWDALQRCMVSYPDIDLGLYECPRPYHRVLSADFISKCAATNRFVFFKETSCDRSQLIQKLDACRDTRLHIYPAHGPSILYGLQHGSAGCSNIAANVVPRLYARLCTDWQSSHARELQDFLSIIDPLIRLGYPASAKRWLHDIGLPISDHCRTLVESCLPDDEQLRFKALQRTLKALPQTLTAMESVSQ